MSGESAAHVRIVEHLISLIDGKHRVAKQTFVLFADHHEFGPNQPPTVGGFKPDIFAQDLPNSFRVIGEAKTPSDLCDPRSSRQILAFLDHLSLYKDSYFYLGVPWTAMQKANGLMKRLTRADHAKITIVITGSGTTIAQT